MVKGTKAKGMLQGRYGLGEMVPKKQEHNFLLVSLGVVGAGAILGYVSYPYNQQPLGMMLMGASGSVIAAGLLLMGYVLFREEGIIGKVS